MVGWVLGLDPSRETNDVDITSCSQYAKTNSIKEDKEMWKHESKDELCYLFLVKMLLAKKFHIV